MPDEDDFSPEDIDELPTIDLPSPEDFVAQEGSVEPLESVDVGAATDLGWEFCLRFNGRPWQIMRFRADTAAEAAGWAEAYTRFVNRVLVDAGFPPACTWTAGACG